jgi:hypothetical protein
MVPGVVGVPTSRRAPRCWVSPVWSHDAYAPPAAGAAPMISLGGVKYHYAPNRVLPRRGPVRGARCVDAALWGRLS